MGREGGGPWGGGLPYGLIQGHRFQNSTSWMVDVFGASLDAEVRVAGLVHEAYGQLKCEFSMRSVAD